MRNLRDIFDCCRGILVKRRLPSGGWSFNLSDQWSTEMTALALLGLRLEGGSACAKGMELLLSQQNPDGSWPAFRGDAPEGSWTTALAVLVLIRLNGGWSAVEKGMQWLLQERGRESEWFEKWRYRLLDRHVQFNPEKYGWPWCPGSSSWVVPTAYSLIALQHYFCCSATPQGSLRIQKGKEMLFDRACPGGGWNAGNSVAFGTPLDPQADVTALALLALLPEKDQGMYATPNYFWMLVVWGESCIKRTSPLLTSTGMNSRKPH